MKPLGNLGAIHLGPTDNPVKRQEYLIVSPLNIARGVIRFVVMNPLARDGHILGHLLVYDNDHTNANDTTPRRVQYLLKSLCSLKITTR